MDRKRTLRARLVAGRAARTSAERDRDGRGIADHGLAAATGARRVLAYAAQETEPPTRPLLDGLVAAGTEVWLPVVIGRTLGWAPYEGWESLRADARELPTPTAPARTTADVGTVDLAFVPALAVDGAGNRLGRGGGYYDRLLAQTRLATIAVVFADEVLDAVPVEPWDVAVDGAVTPEGFLRFGAA
jgi:5-formyltetrahydrofolate cyclo-ligase